MTAVEDPMRDGTVGRSAARGGDTRWRRLTEVRAGAAKSAFHFDVHGTVAHSTHAGLPWLRYLRRQLGAKVHFWPFDGWEPPVGRSAVVEVYPAQWKHMFATQGRTGDQQDAYAVATWLRQADQDGRLQAAWHPMLDESERAIAAVEGWILDLR